MDETAAFAAGTDPGFKPHSTRAAAVSAARRGLCSIQEAIIIIIIIIILINLIYIAQIDTNNILTVLYIVTMYI